MNLRAHLVARPVYGIVPRRRPLSYLENPMNTRTPVSHDPDEPIEADERCPGFQRRRRRTRPGPGPPCRGPRPDWRCTLTSSKNEDSVSLDDLSLCDQRFLDTGLGLSGYCFGFHWRFVSVKAVWPPADDLPGGLAY